MGKKKSKIKKSKQEGSQEISQGAAKFRRGCEILQPLRNFATLEKFRNPCEFDKACTACSTSAFAFFYAF